MPKRTVLAKHLSEEELECRYRQARSGMESRQFHVLWLLAQGHLTENVSQITGDDRNWIYQLVRKYNQQGEKSVGDGQLIAAHHQQNKKPGKKTPTRTSSATTTIP